MGTKYRMARLAVLRRWCENNPTSHNRKYWEAEIADLEKKEARYQERLFKRAQQRRDEDFLYHLNGD